MTGTVIVSSAHMSEHRRRRSRGRGKWKKRCRRKTFTLEHRPGQTRLVLSGLLGNRQGAWSNLLNSASRLLYISLFLFLCLSRSLTFGLHTVFPICCYLSHPLRRLSPSLPLLSSLILCSPSLYQALPSCQCVCMAISSSLSLSLFSILLPSQTSDSVSSQAVWHCHPHIFHTELWGPPSDRQARPSGTYQEHKT